jgi:uncharacterized membrane protein
MKSLRMPSLESLFLVITISFGLLFSFLVPPNQVPDEYSHFYRAYAISEGNLSVEKVVIPDVFPSQVGQYYARFIMYGDKVDLSSYINDFRLTADYSKKSEAVGVNIPPYNPVLYLPQLVGLAFGKLFASGPMVFFVLGRLFSVFFYAGVCFIILKATPIAKRSLFVLFTMPMSIYLASSYSADGMQNILAFSYLVLIIRELNSSEPLSWKKWALFFTLSVLLSLTKPVSLVILLLAFAIPEARFGSAKRRWWFVFAQLGLGGTAVILWMGLNSSHFVSLIPNIHPAEQFLFILLNPISFIKIILFAIQSHAEFYLFGFLGWFGWFSTRMPEFAYFLSLIVLFFAVIDDAKRKFLLTRQQRSLFLGVFLLYALGLHVSMYLYWNTVGSANLEGVQGRYFIPVFPLILCAVIPSLYEGKIKSYFDRIPTAGLVTVLVPMVLFFAIQAIYLSYFVPCGEKFYSMTETACFLPPKLQTETPGKDVGDIDRTFKQTFKVQCDELSEISFLLVPHAGHQPGLLDVKLKDKPSGDVFLNEKIPTSQIPVAEWKRFSFPTIHNAKNRQFVLVIEPLEQPVSVVSLGVMGTDVYPYGKLSNVDFSGDLIFNYTCQGGFFNQLRRLAGR